MPASSREVRESPREQGGTERIAYQFDFASGIVAAPVSATVAVYDITTVRTDVTNTVMPTNSPTIATSFVTCSLLRDLTAGSSYRVECSATGADGQRETLYLVVNATE